jgi:hypothetical protein
MSFIRHTEKRKIDVNTSSDIKNNQSRLNLPSIKNTPILDFKIDKEFLELFNYIETLSKIESDSYDQADFCMEAITGQTHIGKEIYELSGKRVNICLCMYGDKHPFVHFNTRCWIDNEPLYPKFNIYERYFILHYLMPVINPEFKYNLLSELMEVYTKSNVDY